MTVETELTATELSDALATQLAEEGWEREEEHRKGPVKWSVWNMSDESGAEWQTILTVCELPALGWIQAYVRTDLVE